MSMPAIYTPARKPLLIRLMANGVAQALCALLGLLLIRQLFALLASPVADPAWMLPIGSLLLLTLLTAWLRRQERIDAESLGQSYVHEVRQQLFGKLLGLPLNQLQQLRNGSQMLRFVGDLSALRQWIGLGVSRLAISSLTLLFGLAGLAWFDLRLSLAVLVVLVPLVLLMLLEGPKLAERIRWSRRKRSQLAANVHEKLAAIATIQLFGQQRRERAYLRRQSLRVSEAMVAQAGHAGTLRALSELAVGGSVVSLLVVSHATATAPDSATLMAAFSLVLLLGPALRQIGRVYEYWQAYQIARGKIMGLMNRPGYRHTRGLSPSPDQPARSHHWQLRNLSISERLDRINGTLEPGSRICVTGPSGSGKSSLLLAIARLLESESGQILLDGAPLHHTPIGRYRRLIGFVGDQAPLLRGSLRKNLLYRRGKVSAARRDAAWNAADIPALISGLPAGSAFNLGERGNHLSRGQQRQVALSRALTTAPALLLIDDIDQGLCGQQRQKLLTLIQNYTGTLLYSASSPDFMAVADSCWTLNNGRRIDVPHPIIPSTSNQDANHDDIHRYPCGAA